RVRRVARGCARSVPCRSERSPRSRRRASDRARRGACGYTPGPSERRADHGLQVRRRRRHGRGRGGARARGRGGEGGGQGDRAMKVEDSVEIAKPQELVYALVRDLEGAPEWQPSLESVDVQAGTEIRRVGGRRQTATFLIVEDDAPRRLAITSEGGPARARATLAPESAR